MSEPDDVPIKVEILGKKHLIGHKKQTHYSTLRDSLSHGAKSIGNRLIHPLRPNTEETELEEFWALRNINFEIKQGDKVGIIGRNGAGKSTLLKILSCITAPTTGKITLKGRVASLLEVGKQKVIDVVILVASPQFAILISIATIVTVTSAILSAASGIVYLVMM